ncbi:uncharacterized protein LOC116417801 isoform X3 [Nasonia vitripennis]|uniref:CCHC-type domain-containing protein n=1 Tax=Nasonia vitripennis TaxID=7425 RepID=A0A7M7TB85_NASVI|nr:uncharacterized protein LOC116417801 isoform X3 [Nasonia vitripennis]
MSDWSLSDPLPSNEKEVANEGNENQVDDHLYIHQDSDIEGYTPPGTPPKRDMEGKSQPTDSQMEWRMDNLENALERHSDILDNHAEIIRDQTVAILDMKENIDNLNTVIQKLTEQIGKLTSELESDRRKSDGQPSDDRQKIAAKQAIITDKCYRCNKVGHRAAFCPLKEYNLWYCFYCQAVAPHKGDNCPNKDNLKDGYRKPRRN